MTEKELVKLINEEVNEAWYNNKNDFYRGVGKVAVGGALTAGALMGGKKLASSAVDAVKQGYDNEKVRKEILNKETEKSLYGSPYHFEKWCEEENLNPKDELSWTLYEKWIENKQAEEDEASLNESFLKTIIREELMNLLS